MEKGEVELKRVLKDGKSGSEEEKSSCLSEGKAVTQVLAGSMLDLAGWDIHPAPSAQITHGSGTFHSGAPALLGL
ncbi:hypothetical protein AOLI_G00134210 [Acnodon oligacanthus]